MRFANIDVKARMEEGSFVCSNLVGELASLASLEGSCDVLELEDYMSCMAHTQTVCYSIFLPLAAMPNGCLGACGRSYAFQL